MGDFRCLVVAESALRRAMLAGGAEKAGWDTVVCECVESAWHACQRERFEMAVVDFEALGGEALPPMRELTEQIATQRNMLLMLCGNDGDALEEIWARQLGVWLYLPGVREQRDMQTLCAQALPVAERLAGPQRKFVG
jgi:DNA-binding response OmpR family regulator